jgi:pimeloyl-ACP methyl ester carboxylesterase
MAGVNHGPGRVRWVTCGVLASLFCGLAAASPGGVSPSLVEEVWALPLPLPSIAYVVHPAGKGPFPLVIMNHGVAMDPKERSFFPLVEFREAAFWFARRGYLVVAPTGPGYGGSGLDMPERGIHGVFFQKIGKCSNPNFRDAGLMVATLDRWTTEYLSTRKDIVVDNIIVVGQSAGGWGAIALASQNPVTVKAVIVFAAGRGGRVDWSRPPVISGELHGFRCSGSTRKTILTSGRIYRSGCIRPSPAQAVMPNIICWVRSEMKAICSSMPPRASLSGRRS